MPFTEVGKDLVDVPGVCIWGETTDKNIHTIVMEERVGPRGCFSNYEFEIGSKFALGHHLAEKVLGNNVKTSTNIFYIRQIYNDANGTPASVKLWCMGAPGSITISCNECNAVLSHIT